MIKNQSTHLWLARFAGRLVEHFPQMNPLSAVKRAIAMFPELSHLDAVAAADLFAADPDGARSLVMRSQSEALESAEAAGPIPVNFMRQLPAASGSPAHH